MHKSNVTGHFYFLMHKKKKILFICGIQVYKRAWFHHRTKLYDKYRYPVNLWSPPTQLIHFIYCNDEVWDPISLDHWCTS